MTRAGVRETIATSISGHKTRSVFDRYNITDTNDVKEAMQAVVRYNTYKLPLRQSRRIRNRQAGQHKAEVAQW
jgi:hypothetical protein